MNILKKACLISCCTLFVFSCKKNETELRSTRDNLVGSWLLQEQGSDNNNNNTFDLTEKNKAADSAMISYQLINDGSGYRIGANNSFVDTMEWVLFNNETSLHFKIHDKGFVNHQYFKFELGTKTLLLNDTTVSPSFFRSFLRKN